VIPISELFPNDSFQVTIFLRTLDFSCASENQNSFSAFQSLIEIACNLNTKLLLSPQHSQKLRDILLQGFQSSAREPFRDNFVIATMVFLSHLDPSWTLNPSSRGDNKFVMLIVSLICGEYRLLLQELTTLSTEGEESEMNDVTHPLITHHRSRRAMNLCCVCAEIFDTVFSLLVGDGTEEEEEDAGGCWQSLSAGTLQLIQKVTFFLSFNMPLLTLSHSLSLSRRSPSASSSSFSSSLSPKSLLGRDTLLMSFEQLSQEG
jgi:hypothetical protein